MTQFVKRITTEKGSFNFYFNCQFTPGDIRFLVSVVDHQGKSFVFHVVEQTDSWKIKNKKLLPSWLVSLEEALDQAIREQLSFVPDQKS
jgi:hypothetical protein